jgi:hypothetical protein
MYENLINRHFNYSSRINMFHKNEMILLHDGIIYIYIYIHKIYIGYRLIVSTNSNSIAYSHIYF